MSAAWWWVIGITAAVLWSVQTGAIIALRGRVELIVGHFDEAVQAWVDYAEELKDERDQYASALKAALQTNAALVATDAATDAAQAAALQEQLTAQLESALASLQESEPKKPEAKPEFGPGKTTDKGPGYPVPEPYPVPPAPEVLGEGKVSKKDEDTADGSRTPVEGKGEGADFGGVPVVEGNKPDDLKGNKPETGPKTSK